MTQEKFPSPREWLDLDRCQNIYNLFKEKGWVDFAGKLPSFETRYPGRLESVLGSVQQTFQGKYLNPTILEAFVGYLVQINTSHVFKDGNKRMSLVFSHVFLLLNGYDLKINPLELSDIALVIAKQKRSSHDEVKETLQNFFRDLIITLPKEM